MMAGMSAPRDTTETLETHGTAGADAPVGNAGASAVVTVTDRARQIVQGALADETDAGSLALWLEVSGVRGNAYAYDLYFQAASDAHPGDVVHVSDGLTLIVPEASVGELRGATLDVSDEGGEPGLVVVNPNAPTIEVSRSAGAGEGIDLEDPLTLRIVTALDEQVNPSIASHGGRADLVAVEDTTVYLRLSGGCQGCGMAKATLSQGIEVMLREAVPELSAVIDVTDHAHGANPYYERA